MPPKTQKARSPTTGHKRAQALATLKRMEPRSQVGVWQQVFVAATCGQAAGTEEGTTLPPGKRCHQLQPLLLRRCAREVCVEHYNLPP